MKWSFAIVALAGIAFVVSSFPRPKYPPQWTIVHQKTNEFYHGDNWGYTYDNYGCVQAGFTNRESMVREIADMKARTKAQAWIDFKARFKKKESPLRSSWEF